MSPGEPKGTSLFEASGAGFALGRAAVATGSSSLSETLCRPGVDVGCSSLFPSVRSGEAVEESAPAIPHYLEPEQFQHLARVLDRPLFRIAVMSLLPKDVLASWQFSEDDTLLKWSRKPVLVSIKLDGVDDARLAALKKAGFELVATNEANGIVVGRATARQLADIGLLKGVLRVVPTSIQADAGS